MQMTDQVESKWIGQSVQLPNDRRDPTITPLSVLITGLFMSAENQQTYRKRLALLGRCEIKVVIDAPSAVVMRRLALEHNRSHGDVLTLALMLANQRLTAPASPKVAVAESESQLDIEPAPPSPAPKEAWWPANYAALLSEA